jgi:hypothetical protein
VEHSKRNSDSLDEIRDTVARREVVEAWEREDYPRAIEVLSPIASRVSQLEREWLAYAVSMLRRN